METHPEQPVNPEDLRQQLQLMEKEVAMLQLQAQKYDTARLELEKLRQKYADDLFQERQELNKWHDEALRWQHDYEQLRIQKGGFGFHTLSTVVVAVVIITALLTYALLSVTDGRKAAHEAFRREQLFKIEYALSQGHFEQAREIIRQSLRNPEYELAYPQIDMLQEVVQAAEKSAKNRQ